MRILIFISHSTAFSLYFAVFSDFTSVIFFPVSSILPNEYESREVRISKMKCTSENECKDEGKTKENCWSLQWRKNGTLSYMKQTKKKKKNPGSNVFSQGDKCVCVMCIPHSLHLSHSLTGKGRDFSAHLHRCPRAFSLYSLSLVSLSLSPGNGGECDLVSSSVTAFPMD